MENKVDSALLEVSWRWIAVMGHLALVVVTLDWSSSYGGISQSVEINNP